VIPAPDEVALALGVPPRTRVTAMDRLRYADGEPLALLHNLVPTSVAQFTKAELQSHGLYQLLRNARALPEVADEIIGSFTGPTATRFTAQCGWDA
jgi:DNA-binding GntR family transcriptional regulator